MDGYNINQAFQSGLTRVFDFLPQLLGALVLLVIGYIVAVIVKTIVTKALRAVRFDGLLEESAAGKYLTQVMQRPSQFVGKVAYWLVFLGFVSLAISALNIEALNAFMAAIYSYLPHVVAATVIFLVSGAVSVAAVGFVERVMGKTALAKTISAVIPSLVMSIAVFMILNELMIAPEIVTITYTALIGSVALGLALAFGLGGRDVAARLLDQAYESGKRNAGKVKYEASEAMNNAEREADRAKRNMRR